MPATHVVQLPSESKLYSVTKNGVDQQVQILQRRPGDVYVHYVGTDKRLDEWIPEESCKPISDRGSDGHQRRKRGSSIRKPQAGPSTSTRMKDDALVTDGEAVVMTEEDYDILHHKQITAQRNFDMVHFGDWQIKTWYFSPYPLMESEEELNLPQVPLPPKIPGVSRTTIRSHGRTSDLLAGGLQRSNFAEKPSLWVCEMCFKYMTDGSSWELHSRSCQRRHPPGKKVYQRGAHTIWEVDGTKEKLYCQNLSLFGKLFIDVKTLFFDCDNFLFYILTDATSQEDHMLGFFSKEKVSFDDYNLACIMTLPPYQRKGYGMLMIEFSYELSRRAGKVGTPERPLSDLGLRSYLAYWVSALIRFFRRILSCLPPEMPKAISLGGFPDLNSPSTDAEETLTKRRKRMKGWDGEDMDNDAASLRVIEEPKFTSLREFQTMLNKDGSATTHVAVRCTLADLAKATNLRIEDAAFALHECGMLFRKITEGADDDETIVLTRSMIEKVAVERKVKQPCMDLTRVLL